MIEPSELLRTRPVTLALTSVVLLFFLIMQVYPDFKDKVGLVVAHTFITNFYVWNMLTGCLLEAHPLKFLVSILGLGWLSWRVEPLLTASGPFQFPVYVGVTTLAQTVFTSTWVFFKFVATENEAVLFKEWYGSGGLLGALAVAMAHQIGMNQPLGPPFPPQLLLKHVPLALVATWFLLALLGNPVGFYQDLGFLLQGTYAGWVYLRFARHHSGGQVGDVSESFAFKEFFPPAVQRAMLIEKASDFFYGVMLLLGFFKNRKRSAGGGSGVLEEDQAGGGGHEGRSSHASDIPAGLLLPPLPGTGGVKASEAADPVAERRRARAMALLDQKFAQMAKQEVGWHDEEAATDENDQSQLHIQSEPLLPTAPAPAPSSLTSERKSDIASASRQSNISTDIQDEENWGLDDDEDVDAEAPKMNKKD